VPLEFADHIIPDFELGEATWALFLSLKYHLLHPTYLAGRCASIARGAASSSSSAASQPQMAATRLRLILILVDVDDCEKILEDLTVFANAQAWTIILAWSNQEVGRYLETFKAYEKKSADVLKERLDSDAERFHDCFAQVRSINKSDINTLAQSFGSFAGVCGASAESLALLPGLGPKKVLLTSFAICRCLGCILYHQGYSHPPGSHVLCLSFFTASKFSLFHCAGATPARDAACTVPSGLGQNDAAEQCVDGHTRHVGTSTRSNSTCISIRVSGGDDR
jgi:hypothetical protein